MVCFLSTLPTYWSLLLQRHSGAHTRIQQWVRWGVRLALGLGSALPNPLRPVVSLWLSCMQALLAFKATCSQGPVSQLQLLQVGVAISNPVFLRENQSGKFPPDCESLCQGWDSWKGCVSLSYSFWCEFFLPHLMCRSCSASFGFLSQGTILYVAVDVVCPRQQVSSGPSYIAVLIQSPLLFCSFPFAPLIGYFQLIYLQAQWFLPAFSGLLVKHTIFFFTSVIKVFSPKISISFFFYVLSLFNVSFCSCTVFLISLNCVLLRLSEHF